MDDSNTNIMELRYMKRTVWYLNTLGAWPNIALGNDTPKTRFIRGYGCFLILMQLLQEASTIIHCCLYLGTIDAPELALTYMNVSMTIVITHRMTLPLTKGFPNAIKRFVEEFNLMHFKHKNEFAGKMCQRVNKIMDIFSSIIFMQGVIAVISYAMVPVINNIIGGQFGDNKPSPYNNYTYEHPVDFYIPKVDQYHTFRGYIGVFIFQWYVIYNTAFSFCSYDFIMFTLVFHIWGHLNILLNDLKTFPKPSSDRGANDLPSLEENKEVAARLKELFEHFMTIMSFIDSTLKGFDKALCIYLAYHQVTDCVLLLQCSAMTISALSKYGMVTLFMFQQLIQLSMIFELIRSKGDMLADAVYSLPWESMSNANKKSVFIFLVSVQPTIAMKAGGIVPIGVLTMSTIIRTSLSYFVMLQTLGDTQ
uniref:Odorant receptor n=1 Tax=Lobesia botrana TaxID=209534 RepID=A0A345BEU2_9NEOP|nr:odorant receptors OR6 [Lobesia botrana]